MRIGPRPSLQFGAGWPTIRRGMPKPLVDVVKIGKRGEITLPRRLRRALDLQEGDELVLSVEERRMTLERRARHFSAYLDVLTASSGGTGRSE